MPKKDDGTMASRSPVQINVTPLFRQGNEVICDIQPPTANQKGGMIKLSRGNAYALEFTLQPGTPSGLKFRLPNDGSNDGSRAFWCDPTDCPSHTTLDPQYFNPRLSNGDLTLTVEADPAGMAANAVHYRLNFDNNRYFDPIIIHD
jgi:hypothetical protein